MSHPKRRNRRSFQLESLEGRISPSQGLSSALTAHHREHVGGHEVRTEARHAQGHAAEVHHHRQRHGGLAAATGASANASSPGHDDPATHDVGDDSATHVPGQDDPAGHDTATSSPGADDPAGHDASQTSTAATDVSGQDASHHGGNGGGGHHGRHDG